jgi:hypothetical protein
MNCFEIESLLGMYLDSELDARNTREIQIHLENCPLCARKLKTEQALDQQLRSRLKANPKTQGLWEREHRFVLDMLASVHPADEDASLRDHRLLDWAWFRELFWPSPKYYLGLAALWIFLLAVNFPQNKAEPVRLSSLEKAQPIPQMLAGSQKGVLEKSFQNFSTEEVTESEDADQPRSDRNLPVIPGRVA